MAGGYSVKRELAEWLIVALILFALLVEVVLHKLEHWVAHRHAHLQAVLRNLYRELMILGMVSFGFILYIFIKEPSGEIKLTFEVAHVFIFLFAVFHTFVVMCTVFMSLRLSARWKRLERMELVKYLEKKEKYRKLCDRLERRADLSWRYFGWWFPKISRPVRYWKLHEAMAFHDIRFQFIFYRNLPMDFRFSSFLRKIKSHTFIELVEIHWSHFLFFLGFVLLDLARVYSKANFGKFFEPAFLIAQSVLNVVLVSILAGKIRKIYWMMTRNPATYYDQVDRRAFEQELIIAQEEARIEMESLPPSRRISKAAREDVAPEKDEEIAFRKSVDMDRPRMSTDQKRVRRGEAHAHTAASHAKHQPVYANLAYVPPKSIPSSGTHTPSARGDDDGLELEEVVARHSLDMEKSKDGTLDLSSVQGRGTALEGQLRPSARSSFDKPKKYEPALTNPDGSIAMDAVAAAAASSRRSTTTGGGRTSVERNTGRFARISQDGQAPRRPSGLRRASVTQDVRVSFDRRESNASRRSVDMSQTMPTDELQRRTSNSRKLRTKGTTDVSDARHSDRAVSESGDEDLRQQTREMAIQRLKEKARPGASIIDHAQDYEAAKHATPNANYHWLLLKLVPRLKRVASPAEKLFWFGSHKFYMWCVEWVLFFATVNLSATLAKVGFALKERAQNGKPDATSKPAAVVRMLVDTSLRAAKKTKTKTVTDDFTLLMVALLVAFFALFYVLLRVAGIMKKYIFVLNNANMLPEVMTIESIQAVRTKDMIHGDKYEAAAHSDGSDTELEDGEYAQTRRNMSNFFTNEVEGGRMPGTVGARIKRRISISSRRTSSQTGPVAPENVEAVASASMDGTAVAEADWLHNKAQV